MPERGTPAFDPVHKEPDRAPAYAIATSTFMTRMPAILLHGHVSKEARPAKAVSPEPGQHPNERLRSRRHNDAQWGISFLGKDRCSAFNNSMVHV